MKEKRNHKPILLALKAAFPYTLPILAGYLFLGITYGVYARVNGFSFVYPLVMSIVIYGGSLEFVAVSLLMSSFAPLQTLIITLTIQARHLFYGIAMLNKYKDMGKKKWYLIYALSDETFSINYASKIPEGVNEGWFYFFTSLLDQLYWIIGATIGGLAGSLITFNTKGIDFVMTAMFVVIFLEQFLKEKRHYSSIIGVVASIICLFLLGPDHFLLGAMICIVLLLLIFEKPIEKAEAVKGEVHR